MKRVRDFGNRWWEYYPPQSSDYPCWNLCYKQSLGRFSQYCAAHIQRWPNEYHIRYDEPVRINGDDYKFALHESQIETPLDELMERVEAEYEQYLRMVQDFCTALVKDFSVIEKKPEK